MPVAPEQETRERISEYIRTNPGLHLRGIVRRMSLSVGVVEYHVHRLLRAGRIAFVSFGSKKMYYSPGRLNERDINLIVTLRDRVTRSIVLQLISRPGLRFTDMLADLGTSKSTLSFHLNRLVRAEILDQDVVGREKFFWVADPEYVTRTLVSFHETFVDDAVDRFIETWTGL